MSIASAMNAALSGLGVSSKLADITANNIANVGTAGYVRRSADVSQTQNGSGAQINAVIRHASETITEQRLEINSNLSQSTTLSTTWSSLSAQIGDTFDGSGLFQTMNDFETAIAVAANTPESGTEASNLLDAAKAVTEELNDLARTIQSERENADSAINAAVTVVNETLVEIDALNKEIQSALDGSSHQASLEDQRQSAVDTLSNYLPVRTIPDDDGTIDVITTEGVFLLAVEVREVEFSLGSGYTADQSLAGGQLSGLTVAGVDITPGTPSYGAVSSGELAGLFQLRDEDLPQLSAQLDSVANDLVNRFSNDVADATLNPGDPGLFVDPTNAGSDDLALRISINSAVDPDQGGEIWRLRDGIGAVAEGEVGNAALFNSMLDVMQTSEAINENGLQGRYSVTQLSAHISSLAGQQRVSHEATLNATQIEYDRIVEAEQDVTGVDIDTELQNLLLIEQAYSANARVIDATNRFMEELLAL